MNHSVTWFTTSEAATYLGVAAQTLRVWRERKTGPLYRKSRGASGHCMYRKEWLDAYVDAQTIRPRGRPRKTIAAAGINAAVAADGTL